MQRRRKLYAQAEEYDTRVKIRAKMSIAFYIELSTLSLSLSLSPPLSPFLSLSPPLSFSNFRPRSLPLLSDFAINIQNTLFFS
jgi:hypothetical protein